MTKSESTLRLRVVLTGLPPRDWGGWSAIEVGMQRGKSEVLPGVPVGADAVHFDCEVRVGPSAPGAPPNFLGPFAFGRVGERFLYLSWSGEAEGRRAMFRRIKIHLASIRPEQVEEARRSGGRLTVSIAGVGRDGGPACASVPLLGAGWIVEAPATG